MKKPSTSPTVSIIIRTRDRLPFISRALSSIGKQSFTNYHIIVVNDGGDKKKLTELVDMQTSIPKNKIFLLHNKTSQGKWRAANQGVEADKSDFIVLHDDDDSWEPEFLDKTVNYLVKNPQYVGVATYTNLVEESITGDAITQLRSSQFAPELEQVSIVELCKHNIFPPIAYLYRRSVHSDIGLYNDSLNALADWEFNLRTIARYDIGMLRERLANWHHRRNVSSESSYDTRSYMNVTAPNDVVYREHISRMLNSILRDDMSKNQLGVGFLVNLMSSQQTIDNRSLRTHFDARFDDFADLAMNKLHTLHKDINQQSDQINRLYHPSFLRKMLNIRNKVLKR